jgi:hypothetical protein
VHGNGGHQVRDDADSEQRRAFGVARIAYAMRDVAVLVPGVRLPGNAPCGK